MSTLRPVKYGQSFRGLRQLGAGPGAKVAGLPALLGK